VPSGQGVADDLPSDTARGTENSQLHSWPPEG
jgi:hypothetical protein